VFTQPVVSATGTPAPRGVLREADQADQADQSVFVSNRLALANTVLQ
jgi:hypothetical protein